MVFEGQERSDLQTTSAKHDILRLQMARSSFFFFFHFFIDEKVVLLVELVKSSHCRDMNIAKY